MTKNSQGCRLRVFFIKYKRKITILNLLNPYLKLPLGVPALNYSPCFSRTSLIACASWSGQEVFFMPQVTPSTREMTSSMSMPSTSLAIPFRLPLQPPRKVTFLTLLSSRSKKIFWEQQKSIGLKECLGTSSIE